MSYNFLVSWLSSTLSWSTPLIMSSIGELFAEKSGVINMGIEGVMLFGALCGVAVSFYTGSTLMAVLVCILLGAVLGLALAFLMVSRRTNQVVTGLMFNMLAAGATDLIFSLFTDMKSTRVNTFPVIFPNSWQKIPFLGEVFLTQPITTWITFAFPFVAAYIMYKTHWGLTIRATGDYPQAVATAGISVIRIKYQTVILSGIFAALGGCLLTVGEVGYFASGGVTGGRGFIVMAACVVGGWDPVFTMIVCILFGAMDALQLRFQAGGSPIPYQFLQMLPYVVTIISLVVMVRKSRVPKTWGAPYDPKDM